MSDERLKHRRLDAAAAATAALCAALLYWPLLRQPFIRDDIDFQATLSVGSLHGFRLLLAQCMSPFFFRPLAAPLFWLLHAAFGASAAPLRVAIVGLVLAAAAAIFKVAATLSGRRAVGFFSAAFYALSWIHWDGAAMTSNVAEALSHALFWLSLWLFLESDLLPGLAAGAAALLFKEDAVVLPFFYLAALWASGRPHRERRVRAATLTACALLYCAARLVLPGSFASPDSYFHFSPSRIVTVGPYRRALFLLIAPWSHSLLPAISIAGFASWRHSNPGAAVGWAAAVLLMGGALGWIAWLYASADASSEASDPRTIRLATFGLIGFVIGVMPYAAFNAVGFWSCHRLDLAWGGMAIGLGALARAPARRLLGWGPAGLGLFLTIGNVVLLRTAVAFRFPDAASPTFSRLPALYESRQVLSCITPDLRKLGTPGDQLAVEGFDPDERIPQLLRISQGLRDREGYAQGSWLIKRMPTAGRVVVTLHRSPGAVKREHSWSSEPSL